MTEEVDEDEEENQHKEKSISDLFKKKTNAKAPFNGKVNDPFQFIRQNDSIIRLKKINPDLGTITILLITLGTKELIIFCLQRFDVFFSFS